MTKKDDTHLPRRAEGVKEGAEPSQGTFVSGKIQPSKPSNVHDAHPVPL